MHINKDNIRKNIRRVYHGYKVVNKVILNNNQAFKYEILYTGKFEIKRCCTNGTVILQCGAIKIRYDKSRIKPYIYMIQMLKILWFKTEV